MNISLFEIQNSYFFYQVTTYLIPPLIIYGSAIKCVVSARSEYWLKQNRTEEVFAFYKLFDFIYSRFGFSVFISFIAV